MHRSKWKFVWTGIAGLFWHQKKSFRIRRILAQNRTQAMLGFQKWGIMDINALKLNRQDFVENSLSLQVVAERIPCRREGQKLMAGVSALRENVEHTMPYITNLLCLSNGQNNDSID